MSTLSESARGWGFLGSKPSTGVWALADLQEGIVPAGPRIVVLARLEGTPFDPYENGLDSAQAHVEPILRAGIPIVFFSMRTRAELEAIQQELGIRHPFVAEEGGALYVPQHYF